MVRTSRGAAARPGRRIVDCTQGFYQLFAVAACIPVLPCCPARLEATGCWGTARQHHPSLSVPGDHHGRGRWDRFPVNGRAGVLALARPRLRPVGPP